MIADVQLICVQRCGGALPKQVGGDPDKELGKGVLEKAVDQHILQKEPYGAGHSGARHHHQQHTKFQTGIALF